MVNSRLALVLCLVLLLSCCGRRAAPDLTKRSDFNKLAGLCLETTQPLNQSANGAVIYLRSATEAALLNGRGLLPIGKKIVITDLTASSGFDGMYYCAYGVMKLGEREFQVEVGDLLDSEWYRAAQAAATNNLPPVTFPQSGPPINWKVVRPCQTQFDQDAISGRLNTKECP